MNKTCSPSGLANDTDAELCNDDSCKYPEVMGCFGVRSRRRRDAKRSTRRPRREPCALPFCLTHSSSSQSTLHRPHGPLSYADSRLEQPWSAVTAPICPRRSSPGICLSLCVPSPCLSSNTRSLEKKLGLADRKCFIRPPPPLFCGI